MEAIHQDFGRRLKAALPALIAKTAQREEFDPRTVPADELEPIFSEANIEVVEAEPSKTFFQALRVPGFTVTKLRIAYRGQTHLKWKPSSSKGSRRYVLLFVSRGELEVEAPGDRYARLGEGLLIGFPSEDPISLKTDSVIEGVGISFDFDEVYPHAVNEATAHEVDSDSAYFAAAFSALNALVSPPTEQEDSESAPPIKSMLGGVVKGVMLQVDGSDVDPILHDSLVMIASEYTRPSLTPGRIAKELGVSASTLRRHFAPLGRSPAAEIKRHRLVHAKRLLDSDEERRPLATVAELSGFGSVDALRRALKADSADEALRLPANPELQP